MIKPRIGNAGFISKLAAFRFFALADFFVIVFARLNWDRQISILYIAARAAQIARSHAQVARVDVEGLVNKGFGFWGAEFIVQTCTINPMLETIVNTG